MDSPKQLPFELQADPRNPRKRILVKVVKDRGSAVNGPEGSWDGMDSVQLLELAKILTVAAGEVRLKERPCVCSRILIDECSATPVEDAAGNLHDAHCPVVDV
jgi:hypothetical protein